MSSFLRAAAGTRTFARRFATVPPKKDSNLPYYLLGGGVAGLSLYLYLDWDNRKAVFEKVDQDAQKSKDPISVFDSKEFRDFKLKRTEPCNHNTTKYVFELPENAPSKLPVSSCVLFRASDAESLQTKDGKPVVRPYTPTSPSDLPGEMEFIVKRYENGAMSQYLHTLKPGDSLAIKGPLLKFPYKMNEYDEIGMVAGGSGITPMYQVLQHALADPSNKTKFTLLFGNVEERDILLKEEFDKLKKKHPDTFEIIHVLGTPPEGWKGPSGFITKELMQKHFGGPEKQDKIKILVCGPPAQVAAVAGKKEGMKQGPLGGALKELGYEESQVFKY
ncbi:cytochrome-b5 reductase [Punctularia strigosozonata HHB-11173 SS5]|uniref:cytochrome-b5 reductase n=1 Tax=Punctularia strigosozonata (strain HHB-11173) TaxID=741275 RepID=UPI0004417460|nr:cytochrome-b5 reductase [Punctularia strigosozonata HHB-11173 SS5]EIN14232.1 cytochrome-b5 reductase [Punctularia strigosozonata HHB-11173 SS5]